MSNPVEKHPLPVVSTHSALYRGRKARNLDTCLLIVVEWLKSDHLSAKHCFFAPLPTSTKERWQALAASEGHILVFFDLGLAPGTFRRGGGEVVFPPFLFPSFFPIFFLRVSWPFGKKATPNNKKRKTTIHKIRTNNTALAGMAHPEGGGKEGGGRSQGSSKHVSVCFGGCGCCYEGKPKGTPPFFRSFGRLVAWIGGVAFSLFLFFFRGGFFTCHIPTGFGRVAWHFSGNPSGWWFGVVGLDLDLNGSLVLEEDKWDTTPLPLKPLIQTTNWRLADFGGV